MLGVVLLLAGLASTGLGEMLGGPGATGLFTQSNPADRKVVPDDVGTRKVFRAGIVADRTRGSDGVAVSVIGANTPAINP